ncbi:MAG: HipA domain-containing protein [Lachnospiraceae bacterium]|nr:HipA domain-containing protein [Lachnospiraceae bacterium]
MSGVKTYDVTQLEKVSCRSGSDGYQAKYYADNREKFIKTQAMLSGVLMRDWQVEIIASKICDKLDIYSVKQTHCKVSDGTKTLDAVISDNFEMEGFDYISFETLLNRILGESTHDSKFLRLTTLDKMDFCAKVISKACSIDNKYALKYMLDLAIIDILVGNKDRHTKNFGVFWDINNKKFKIARIFDNGMGLFENDYYRDSYKSIEDRMRNLYIEPYGEDPFDLIDIIKSKININNIYNFKAIKASDYSFPNNDSKIYFKEILKRLEK